MAHTTGSIAQLVGADLRGPSDLEITRLDTLDRAGPGTLSFVRSISYASQWRASKASGVLVTRGIELAEDPARAVLLVPDADLALVRVLELFAPRSALIPGIHPTAFIDPTAKVGQAVHIGPHCTMGPRSTIGDGAALLANVSIGADVAVGRGTTLHPGVVIGDRCKVGQGCILYGGVVIGADGFGYRPAADGRGLVKIPHIGNVEIGDGVEIGANSCVDRAKFGATVIGAGTKIDNLVQVGHNCRIGRACLICGHAGLAGSVTLGDGVILAGCVAIADNLTIGDRAVIAAKSGVMNDVPAGETWWGYPATRSREMARSMAVHRYLPEMARAVRNIAKKVGVEFSPGGKSGAWPGPAEGGPSPDAPAFSGTIPNMPSRTIATATEEIPGRGLFSGKPASVRILPAPPGTGITFQRVDLAGAPAIPASIRTLATISPARNTNLSVSPAAIAMTVEHIMSALAGQGVTDALVELRGPEVPIGDGSATMFTQTLRFAGFADKAEGGPEPIRLTREVVVESGDARIIARPRTAPGFSYTYELDYGPGAPIPRQSATWPAAAKGGGSAADRAAISTEYARQIAPSRTFCLKAEAEQMRAAGLFKDFSPRDLLVIGDTGPIENAYRFDNEPARHKLLDLIGDLALVGRPIQADIVATRAGHALNHAMARALVEHTARA